MALAAHSIKGTGEWLRCHSRDLVKIWSLQPVALVLLRTLSRRTSSSKGFIDIFLLDVEVVVTESRNSTLVSNFICLVCFIGLNSRVMDASFMLSHQNVVLFALLINLDLLVKI